MAMNHKPGERRSSVFHDLSAEENRAGKLYGGPGIFRQPSSVDGSMRRLTAESRTNLPQVQLDETPGRKPEL